MSSGSRKHNETAIRMYQQDAVKYDLHVKAYIQDIRECVGPVEVLSTLNLQVSENMRALRNSIEELERLAVEQDKEKDKKELLKETEKYRNQLSSNQSALRKANLACQNLIDKQNKEELFEQHTSKPRQRIRADKESLVKQSSSVTDSLVTLNNLMSMQVKQSAETLHTLVSSSANVTDTSEEFKSMGSTIEQARKLLHKYSRREVTDKVLIALAVAFFLSCIFYVVQKRLF